MDKVKNIEDELKALRKDMQKIKELDYNLMNRLSSALVLIDKRLVNMEKKLDLVVEYDKTIIDESKKVYSEKDMYIMFKNEGMTQGQIAERCGCSLSTVKNKIKNYKNKLSYMKAMEDATNE